MHAAQQAGERGSAELVVLVCSDQSSTAAPFCVPAVLETHSAICPPTTEPHP